MSKAKVIAISNQKGGVGKTTSAISFGVGLADKGYKVLLVDCDDTGNPSLTKFLGENPDELEATLTDLMMFTLFDRSIDEVLPKVICKNQEGVYFIPADNKLPGITNALTGFNDEEKKKRVLCSIVDKLKDQYDYIILDAAPSLNILSINLLAAADEVIIATQSQGASESGIGELIQTVIRLRDTVNPQLSVRGLLITMVDNRTGYSKAKAAEINNAYTALGMRVFKTCIPRAVKAEKCPEAGQSILKYDPSGKVAVAYKTFVEEYLEE
ncbi:ParA family protein [Aminipila butyrica]|uniref:Sporulation initiation inhibitor protein Soj n=1 Tax=Aminipila butyrica TaxID=433296 RepID=A0A858BXA9_9FIRM|nr:ParA family protein [Aminipila butyrica]QIB69809.1 ParA family protein [Aminipila butyrica]